MNIVKLLSKNRNHFSGVNPCNYITIHQTGNTGKGSNARNHAKYMNNGSPTTWHYTVDSNEVIQHFNDSVQCWHSGDGKGRGNTQSIGIELCVNSDGDYNKTIHNAIELVKSLMKKHNIPITNVVQHNHWSGKNCPSQIRDKKNGISWNTFINLVRGEQSYTPPIKIDNSYNDEINKLAKDVIRGKYGVGETRRKMLGSKYNIVQKRVNELLK